MDLTKRTRTKVEGFNKALAEAVAEIGDGESFIDEYGDMLAIKPMRIDGNELVVEAGYIELGEPQWTEERYEIVMEEDGEKWVNEEVGDQIAFYRKAVRKGLKYFKTYDPSKYDNDDEAYERYMDEL